MVYNNNRVISTDKKSESSSTGSNSTTTGKMCSANTPIVPYNLRKHATTTTTTTATTTMASAIVASAPRRTTTRTVAATTTSKPPVSAATKTATTKPTTATKPTTNSTNKPVTTRSNKPSTTASSSSSSAAIKKLCFERQSTLISSSVDNDTTVVNDITVVEKKIDDKKKKKRASPLTIASSKLSGYEEEDDDDDDDDEEIKKEFKQPPKPQPAVVGKNTARKAPPNKKLRKLRLCDTPHTPKTLMKKSSFDLLTPKTSTNDRVVSPVAAPSVFGEKLTKSTISVPPRMKQLPSQHISDAAAKLSAVKQALTANFVDDVEMILMETTVGDEDGLRRRELQPTKTPARPPRYQSRFTPKNLQPKQALTFDDSDNESSSSTNSITVSSSAQTTTTNREAMNFMSSDEMTFKRFRVTSESSSNGIFSHQRQSSLQSMFNVMKTPAPTSSSSAIHASINPFTPPGGGAASTTSSREVSLVRVAAANYSAVKQKASSLAALSTTTASTEVESARMPIRKCLVSRYHQEFHEVCKLGSGEFGDVFKCINRLDGCTYAIKRSKLAIAGSALEVAAWKEVCAHAVLVKHNHIVQYYSAWAEMDRMLIQNEYCNGGSLAEFLDTLRLSNMHTTNTATSAGLLSLPPSPSPSCSSSTSSNPSSTIMSECDLKTLLLHVAKGLSYMHSLHLAHLDIKPGNIFICRSPRRQQMHSSIQLSSMKVVGGSLTSTTTTTTTMEGLVGTSSSSALLVSNEESGIESDDLDESETESTTSSVLSSSSSVFSDIITYKIGDLGHVTSTLHENPHVEEGDCRYLPNEILQENYSWLVKADVFALALTVFVAGSLEDLPKNGDEWHWIRQGNLKDLPQCSDRFKKLLQLMIHEDPSQRPSASTLVHHPCICPDSTKSKSQLRKELNQEKFKNEMLQRKVKKYEEQIHKLDSPLNPIAPNIRHLNQDLSRSKQKIARSFSSTGLI